MSGLELSISGLELVMSSLKLAISGLKLDIFKHKVLQSCYITGLQYFCNIPVMTA